MPPCDRMHNKLYLRGISYFHTLSGKKHLPQNPPIHSGIQQKRQQNSKSMEQGRERITVKRNEKGLDVERNSKGERVQMR